MLGLVIEKLDSSSGKYVVRPARDMSAPGYYYSEKYLGHDLSVLGRLKKEKCPFDSEMLDSPDVDYVELLISKAVVVHRSLEKHS